VHLSQERVKNAPLIADYKTYGVYEDDSERRNHVGVNMTP
jgi:hypothetical protein